MTNQTRSTPLNQDTAVEKPALLPRVDVLEDDTGITLLADLPRVSKENLELRIDGETLHIEAEIGVSDDEEIEIQHLEVQYPRYRRSFSLSPELDAARIDAQLKDGVLRLRIPKHAHSQPRRIEITAA